MQTLSLLVIIYSCLVQRLQLKLTGPIFNCVIFKHYVMNMTVMSSKLSVTGLCDGNSPATVNFTHKRTVTAKMLPFDDVIMFESTLSYIPMAFRKSRLVQAMVWCFHTTCDYVSQWWHRSMSRYGITRPQSVNQTTVEVKVWLSYYSS